MQRLGVSGAVRPVYVSLGVKRLIQSVQTKTGAQTVSYSVGTDSIFLGLS